MKNKKYLNTSKDHEFDKSYIHDHNRLYNGDDFMRMYYDENKSSQNKKASKVCLFINWYKSDNAVRNSELDYCLTTNLDNDLINKVIIISKDKLPFKIKGIKIKYEHIDDDLTYSDIFDIMNKYMQANTIGILANSDIYFDESLLMLHTVNMNNVVYCLTRYDILDGDTFENKFRNKSDSQDVWIFSDKIKQVNADFGMGIKGCDNRLAYELQKSGYKVLNPSLSIKSYHYHLSEYRSKLYNVEKISKPYLLLDPIYLVNDNKFVIRNRPGKVLLHIGMNPENQKCMIQALNNASDEYKFIDWKRVKETFGDDYKNYILNEIYQMSPNLIFMQIQTPDIITSDMIDIINKMVVCKIVNWSGDVREPLPEWYANVGKINNVVTCFTNEDDVKELSEKYNCKSYFLQIGYEHTVFTKDGSIKPAPDIVFFGNNYGKFPLSKLRYDMVNLLNSTYGSKFQVYGTGWGGMFNPINLNNKSTRESEIYRSCKIAINLSHFDKSRYASDRLFRAMGCGAFVLTHNYTNIAKDFKSKYHLDVWNNFDELLNKIDYYIEHDAERIEIAKNGNQLIESKFRWSNRISELFQLLNMNDE